MVTHKSWEFSSPQLSVWRDLRSLRFWKQGIMVLARDPMKCKERDSDLAAEDRMSTRAPVEPLPANDGLKQMNKDRTQW